MATFLAEEYMVIYACTCACREVVFYTDWWSLSAGLVFCGGSLKVAGVFSDGVRAFAEKRYGN